MIEFSPMWQSRIDARGYDHPKDRLGDAASPEVPLFSDEQIDHILRQQGEVLGEDLAIQALGKLALDRSRDRKEWEEKHLLSMGLLRRDEQRDTVDALYDELAGNPEQLTEFIDWFDNLTALLDDPAGNLSIIDSRGSIQGDSFLGQLKGHALEVGTAVQVGEWRRSDFLDATMLRALRKMYQAGTPIQANENLFHILRRHRLRVVEHESSVLGVHVVRERPFADVEGLHVIKRSEAFVAVGGLINASLERKLLAAMSETPGNGASLEIRTDPDGNAVPLDPVHEFLWDYERVIHTPHEKLEERVGSSMGITPLSTTYLVRRPAQTLTPEEN